ncbi:MAG TPA: DUF2309 domain-containing protein [Gemmataceae bacterium]|nr:DUF2309 domain-containing protein [Gemmataceae bacterium]
MKNQFAAQVGTSSPGASSNGVGVAHGRHAGVLAAMIEHAAHLLPAQGPITVFIHHNTLHAFEDQPFDEAVQRGGKVFGCEPYMSEDWYRDHLRRGRIRSTELTEVLQERLGDHAAQKVLHLATRLDLRLAMLLYPLRSGPTQELVWFVAEKDAFRCIRGETSSAVHDRLIAETRRWVMRDLRGGDEANRAGHADEGLRRQLASVFRRLNEAVIETWNDADWEAFTLQALWRICCDGIRGVPASAADAAESLRHRDALLHATGVDADEPVHEVLIRFCAAYLDQGLSHWQLPRRDEGFLESFRALYRQPGGPPAAWLHGLSAELDRLEQAHISALESIEESLNALGVPECEWPDFLSATLLALRGWAGMIAQVEARGDKVVHPVPAGSLDGFLAIRLLLDRWSLQHIARTELGYSGPLHSLRDELQRRNGKAATPSIEQRAFLVFQLAQVLGWTPEDLRRLEPAQWTTLIEEIETFSEMDRRRIFHLAFERRFRTQTLDAIAIHARNKRQPGAPPKFQVVCCLDEREESFRRHLEEIAPEVETFGAAGFYAVAMYYRGAADAHFVPLCPVVIRPQHWVTEEVDESLGETHRRRAATRKALGTASHQIHVGSRSFALGALLTAAVGVLASFPLIGRILFPRVAAKLRRVFGGIVQAPPKTRLQLERGDATPGPENGHVGFSLDEMTGAAERLLREIGLTANFSPLVLLIGHGSNSLNNPHNSAYNCGACGGAAGGPNARAMAHILNDPRVREKLAQRGLVIGADIAFVGGYHNTCDDSVTFYDVDRIPDFRRQEFAAARKHLDATCERNAHERCRRFMSAPLTMSFADARMHVEERSEDLSQTRPECGHATNAICVVGRRDITRGLYLDRRAFLTSYDPTQDDADGTILLRILSAVFPVCCGINLEYFFSYVDNDGWGCGTKLPHNISALLGVMNGAASDLRTGLPWQMVEIHEPVRLLIVIETTREVMFRMMERNEGIARLCRMGWIQLALIEPHTRTLTYFQDGDFRSYQPQATELPRAASSVDWYRGWREHLEFAEIG